MASLGKQMRARLLRALGRRLTSRPVYSRFRTGRMQQILHARVPILKFVCEDTGAACCWPELAPLCHLLFCQHGSPCQQSPGKRGYIS